ncbi:MAG TPA: N-acetylmuramoyl-L-alanine amidase [Lachnoclostridium sp.]|jgi:N-acetylmuramoyl-L-alanine amidase|uniref:peptidoglycan recognition protein family protein n=1 Tax=Lacrimispora sp. TaxID=2719234 RepID=UPI000EEF8FCE|nr:peptidoglycan recognition family protein [Lacrimispora sp.]HCD44314.1 N-acetylmuramoyl-L-alanine amidase [Lachnoclostridium sp.]
MKNQTKESYDELERRRRARDRRQKQKRQQKRKRIFYIVVRVFILSIALASIVWGINLLFFKNYVDLKRIPMPDWVEEDFIETNPYSRPGTEMKRADGIVIHYVANPGTTAKQNLNYFDSLKDQTGDKKISASSHFMIGLEGEILQGIPIYEVAYATSKEKNVDTVSIECCHPDETGKFNEATYDSLVKLTAWLCRNLGLTEKDVIRHYDATGKDCPRYFVAHEDAWKKFLSDVKAARKQPVEGER